MVPLEAMAAGTPVVATRHPTTCEVVGTAAALVPEEDAAAMAAVVMASRMARTSFIEDRRTGLPTGIVQTCSRFCHRPLADVGADDVFFALLPPSNGPVLLDGAEEVRGKARQPTRRTHEGHSSTLS